MVDVFVSAVLVFFGSPQQSFEQMNRLTPNGYKRSYHEHRRWHRVSQSTALVSFFFVLLVNIALGWLTSSRPVYAATCSISVDTTIDQVYIDTNTCTDITVNSSATLTFTEAIDLGGAADHSLTINSGVTATFNGALILSDSGDSLIIDGIVTHAPQSSIGVDITATTLTVSGTGAINADVKGCSNPGAANGYGPNGSNVCTISTAGYGQGANVVTQGGGGAGHAAAGGDGNGKVGGVAYDSQTNPVLLGSSGGAIGGGLGGTGGGLIKLNIAGTLTHNGLITADGGPGTNDNGANNRAGGGGSGGSINVSAGTLNGSTGTFSNDGGAGGDNSKDGGGGAGGITVLNYTSGSFALDRTDFTAASGTATGTAKPGGLGTVFQKQGSSPNANITIYYGFAYDDADYTETSWTVDSSADGQYCSTGAATPSITAGTISLDGAIACNVATLTSFNLSASSSFNVASGFAMSTTAKAATVDFNIPNGNNQNWDAVTFIGGQEGLFTVNDAVDLVLQNGTVISANVNWTNLTNVSLDSSSSINANSKGCLNTTTGKGFGPDGFNVCTIQTAGWGNGANTTNAGGGGAGYGGTGGKGDTYAGGVTYGSPTAPVLYGSSGGAVGGGLGGSGGGLVRIQTTGTFTHDGGISVDGGNGTNDNGANSRAGGGGSGGSIYLSSDVFNGTTGTCSAIGGAGGDNTKDGGGGGGGRITIEHNSGSYDFDSGDFSAAGGFGPGNALDGSNGTVFVKQGSSPTATVKIYHGFNYDDTDYAESSWTIDPSATNQYCDTGAATPSITADTLTFAGSLSCNLATISSFNLSAATTFSMSSGTVISVNNRTATMDFNIPVGNDQVWDNVTITGSPEGKLTIDDSISLTLQNGTAINANTNFSSINNLTLASGTKIDASDLGCQAIGTVNGYGPNGSNVCTLATAGYGTGINSVTKGGGGGGHGGPGGNSSTGAAGGIAYDNAASPTLFGSSGGSVSIAYGGGGGGLVNIQMAGTLSNSGSILADGGTGSIDVGNNRTGGGGSGGSIFLAADTLAGTGGVISVAGGLGRDTSADSGSGGGGRARITYAVDSSDWYSGITASSVAPGGAAVGVASAGSDGSYTTLQYSTPTQPSVNTPADAASNIARIPSVTTSAYSSNGALHTSTDYQISDDNTFSNDCSDTNIVWCSLDSASKTSVTVNAASGTFQNSLAGKASLAPSSTYYVRVRHTNAIGDSIWSASSSFTTRTNIAPTQPVNTSPANTATGVSQNPGLTASVFSDSDVDSHASSSWQVFESTDCTGTPVWQKSSDASNLTTITVNTTNGTFADTHVGQSKLKSHTTFSYQVKYNDGLADSLDSSCTSFSTTNNSPTLSSIVSSITLIEDTDVTGVVDLDDNISDVDWNDTTFTCSVNNDINAGLGSMALNGNNTVDFTLAADANGSDTIQFSCADAGGASVATNSITVTITPVNDVPSFSKGSNQTIAEDSGDKTVNDWASSISSGPSNESSQTVSFTVTNDNNSLFSVQPAVSSNGALAYTSSDNANGSATVTVSATDNGGDANGGVDTSASQSFTITVSAVNDTPVANAGANVEIDEDTLTTILSGTSSYDIDSDPLTYSWVESLDNGDACSINSVSSSTPTVTISNRISNYSCVYALIVSDGVVDSSTDSVNISVSADNDQPSLNISVNEAVEIEEGDHLIIPVSSSDIDNNEVELSAEAIDGDIPADQLFTDNGDNTGLFDWDTTDNDAGEYTVRFSATDGNSQAQQDVLIDVADIETGTTPPVNNAPTFKGKLPNIGVLSGAITGQVFDLDKYFSDSDGDTLSYKMSKASGIQASIKSGKVRLAAANGMKNKAAITFTATDADGVTVTSNEVIVEVSAAKLKNVSHVEGANSGKGKIKVIGTDGKAAASWRAFPKGGSVPRLANINGEGYVFVVKLKSGSTMQVYKLNGDLVTKKKLSPKLHWRRLATGTLNSDETTEEIVTSTKRGSTLYLKVFSFDPAQKKFSLVRHTAYKPMKSANYSVEVKSNRVYIYKPNGKKAFSWKPFK